jgi:hypothetical protein
MLLQWSHLQVGQVYVLPATNILVINQHKCFTLMNVPEEVLVDVCSAGLGLHEGISG